MRYKYVVTRNDAENKLKIEEFSELDKELFSLVCEESYDAKEVKKALKSERKKLLGTLRTVNMYPVEACAEKIADAVKALYKSSGTESVEVLFEDVKGMPKAERIVFEAPVTPVSIDAAVDVELDDDDLPKVDDFIDVETDEED